MCDLSNSEEMIYCPAHQARQCQWICWLVEAQHRLSSIPECPYIRLVRRKRGRQERVDGSPASSAEAIWTAESTWDSTSTGRSSRAPQTRKDTPRPCPALALRYLTSSYSYTTLSFLPMMHLPFTPNHIQLITACYPPSAALLTSAPEYRPNAQELSRLTYYAANRPGKINKLGGELEKRIKTEIKKAKAGNARSRAYVRFTPFMPSCSPPVPRNADHSSYLSLS